MLILINKKTEIILYLQKNYGKQLWNIIEIKYRYLVILIGDKFKWNWLNKKKLIRTINI